MRRLIAALSIAALVFVAPAFADKKQDKALRKAVTAGSVSAARAALTAGADVNSFGLLRGLAIDQAIKGGKVEMVELLVEAGAKLTPAHTRQVAGGRGTALFEYLLEKGADPAAADVYGDTALNAAALAGNLEVVQLLLARGLDPNVRTMYGSTPLMTAAAGLHLDVAIELVKAGADRAAVDASGRSAANRATSALWRSKPKSLETALVPGLELLQLLEETETAALGRDLIEGARRGDLAAVQAALKKGVSPNYRSSVGATALMGAVLGNHREVAAELLAAGANVVIRQEVPRALYQSAAKTIFATDPDYYMVGRSVIEMLGDRPHTVIFDFVGEGMEAHPDYDAIPEEWVGELRAIAEEQRTRCYVEEASGAISLVEFTEPECTIPFEKEAVVAAAEAAMKEQFPWFNTAIGGGVRKRPTAVVVSTGIHTPVYIFEIDGAGDGTWIRTRIRQGGRYIMGPLFLKVLDRLGAAESADSSS